MSDNLPRFDAEKEECRPGTVADRLDWQEGITSALASAIHAFVRERMDEQEGYLETLYKPQTRRAKQQIRRNRERAEQVRMVADSEARVALAEQASALARLERALGITARVPLAPVVVPPAPAPAPARPAPAPGPDGPAPAPDTPAPAPDDYMLCTPYVPGIPYTADPFKGATSALHFTFGNCSGDVWPRYHKPRTFQGPPAIPCGWGVSGRNDLYIPDDCWAVEVRAAGTGPPPPTAPGWSVYGTAGSAPLVDGDVWLIYRTGDPACMDRLSCRAADPTPVPVPPTEPAPPEPTEPPWQKPAPLPIPAPQPPAPPPGTIIDAPWPAPDIPFCDLDWAQWQSCARIDAVIEGLTRVGTIILSAIDSAVDAVVEALGRLGDGKDLPIVGPVFAALGKLGVAAGHFIMRAWEWLTITLPQPLGANGPALLAAWFTRGVIRSLEAVPIGINFAVVGTAAVRTEFVQIDRILGYLIEYICPTVAPTPAEVQSLVLNDLITEPHARCLTHLSGYQWSANKLLIDGQRQRPTADQLFHLHLRGLMSEPALKMALRQQGWLRDEDYAAAKAGYDYLPGPSDLIRFAVKDVFDPHKLGLAEMREELDEQKELLALLEQQGIKPIQGRDGSGGIKTWDIPYYYWVASYDEISPTQSYIMLQRLRANRTHRYTQRITPTDGQLRSGEVAGAEVIDNTDPSSWIIAPSPMRIVDVQKLLKEKDYNPIWRHRLAAISYRPVGRTDARNMYRLGVFGPPILGRGLREKEPGKWEATGPAEIELYEQFQDQGYAPADAIAQTVLSIREIEKQQRNQAQRGARAAVCQLLTVGGIGADEAKERMRAVGFPEIDVTATVADCSTRLAVRELKAYVSAVRKLFMRGSVDRASAGEQLSRAGIRADAVGRYLDLWSIQRAGSSPEVRARQLCVWMGAGLITEAEVRRRLANQGFAAVDIERIVRHCHLGHLARTAREQRQAVRAAESAARRARAEQEKMARERERLEGVPEKGVYAAEKAKEVKGWWKDGILNEEQVRRILRRKRWNDENIDRWMRANRPAEE